MKETENVFFNNLYDQIDIKGNLNKDCEQYVLYIEEKSYDKQSLISQKVQSE